MKLALAQKLILKTRKYYEKHGESFAISRQRDWPLFLALLQYIKKGDKVLDLGCGSGRFCALVRQKGAKYLGADTSKKLLAEARKNYPRANFRYGDVLKLKAAPQSFDVIALIAVFHHLPSIALRKQALQKLAKALKPGGIILL
ncbi:MAG: methyltransferase domain-containing protein, partial [bacterium]|nr:methyltransferase domain-containing protein [bacterium]